MDSLLSGVFVSLQSFLKDMVDFFIELCLDLANNFLLQDSNRGELDTFILFLHAVFSLHLGDTCGELEFLKLLCKSYNLLLALTEERFDIFLINFAPVSTGTRFVILKQFTKLLKQVSIGIFVEGLFQLFNAE